ncbi:DUF3052 family protein [Streptomyces luteolus]|uniref:DUF3052 family protein n=1 Tax=Streptomyces luteolus TaxID=3043615 RepID=UPI0038D09128
MNWREGAVRVSNSWTSANRRNPGGTARIQAGPGRPGDPLVDGRNLLANAGHNWLLTPKAGREAYVEPGGIRKAATTAGLSQKASMGAAGDWTGTRLVAPTE